MDDLKEIGDLELYIDQTLVINIFLSHWYFKSKNCLREVQATVDKSKPVTCHLMQTRTQGSTQAQSD